MLRDKVVVVTGSTRGIGRAIAEACAADGARVVVSSRHQQAVDETCKALATRGYQVTGTAANVASPDDLERLLHYAQESWGKVDVWVNNAGVAGPFLPEDEWSMEEIDEVVRVNLIGTLQASKLVIPHFRERGGGVLLNMSGRGGRGDLAPFTTIYAATKAAIVSLTKSLAGENRRYPISIHAIMPGMVATDLYRNMKSSSRLADSARSIPYVLKAIGVPLEVVGPFVAGIAAQEPGKETGKLYSLFKGRRMMRGIALLTWFRATGKIKTE